jgi:glucosylceramidase
MTECSTGPTGIAGQTTGQVLASTRNWASGVLLWNLALDPDGGPKQGHGCDGCTGLVTVDPVAGTATPTINYYELGQFSKFVAPGAHRLASTDGNGVAAQAYLNPDGSAAVVAYNTGAAETAVTVRWRVGGTFTFTLPAGATVTFTDP